MKTRNYSTELGQFLGKFLSPTQITLIFSNKTVMVDNSNPSFREVFNLSQKGDYVAAAEATDVRGAIERSFASVKSGSVRVVGDNVLYNGTPLHGVLVDRIRALLRQNAPVTALVNFLNNLLENPSYAAVQELYLFLESNQIPITEDGHFLAWKKVKDDYFDIHSGTVRYKVGDKPSMPRNQVDEDRNRTCSKGLHVCGWSYLPCFGSNGSGTRVVIVKVNPRDVVAVPADYANAKMRVALLEVIREHFDRDLEDARFGDAVVASDGERFNYLPTVLDDEDVDDIDGVDWDGWEGHYPSDGDLGDDEDVWEGSYHDPMLDYGIKPDGSKFYNVKDSKGRFVSKKR